MTNTELYINGKLCDLNLDFAMRLNRKLLAPGELNTKDAQFSYSISVPFSEGNDEIFNYTNIEETGNKFNRVYTAVLLVNSVLIFSGNFRLSKINKGYTGNLYIPSLRSIKDIFGDIKLNQNPEYRIPFLDFADSVSLYNNAARTTPQMAIFPIVLYGVLPKVPLNKNANTYSARNIWDESVYFSMQDLAPSINPLLMIKHIFESQGYNIVGSAYDDGRLLSLYMSYKNNTEYIQPWNYGYHANMRVSGAWSSIYNKRTGSSTRAYERGINQGSDDTGAIYSIDFLDTTNALINIDVDNGGNVLLKEVIDADGSTIWINGQIRIPSAGFYKVEFDASLKVNDDESWRFTDSATGVQHISGRSVNAGNRFNSNIYSMRVLRDKKQGDFGLSNAKLDGTFYRNNQPQNSIYDGANVPKYLPTVPTDGQINMVDITQDRNLIVGFEIGINSDNGYGGTSWQNYINPRDETNQWCQIIVSKPALSWDASEGNENPTRLAIKSPGYWKYGRIGNFDNEGDNPNQDIDYSTGTRVTGQILDANGTPIPADNSILTTRFTGYYLSVVTGFMVPDAAWSVTDFILLAAYNDLRFTLYAPINSNLAIVAFYDINKQYIGYQFEGAGGTTTFTNEPVIAPSNAVYVRLSGYSSNPFTVTGVNLASDNVILVRFPLPIFYTWVIQAPSGSGYTGNAYLFQSSGHTTPWKVIPFVNGVAVFDTVPTSTFTYAPEVSFYLATSDFDVDGTLTIGRTIVFESEEVIGWEASNKYHIDLINAPSNFIRKGRYAGSPADENWNAQGSANAIVWFEAGELITVAAVSSEGRYRDNGMHSSYGLVGQQVEFDLTITPFKRDPNWLKVDLAGRGLATMNWNDPTDFDTDSINIVGFLNADMKTDDFIDNICKAFNLNLSQLDAKTFSLDVKQEKTAVSNLFINLDNLASVKDRSNTPLGLPSLYKLGFTIDLDEEGYVTTLDDGGGEYATGVTEESVVEQKSVFSYNWFKNITKIQTGGNIVLPIPVISKKDVWNTAMNYPEAMRKKYTDQAYRFWYFDGLLNDLGATFDFNGGPIDIAKVSNSTGDSILNYKNQPFTILDNFFTVLINGSSHYTELEGFVTPLQYEALNGSIMAMYNGDIYYVAELSGYDPTNRNKTIIKLIRKI